MNDNSVCSGRHLWFGFRRVSEPRRPFGFVGERYAPLPSYFIDYGRLENLKISGLTQDVSHSSESANSHPPGHRNRHIGSGPVIQVLAFHGLSQPPPMMGNQQYARMTDGTVANTRHYAQVSWKGRGSLGRFPWNSKRLSSSFAAVPGKIRSSRSYPHPVP